MAKYKEGDLILIKSQEELRKIVDSKRFIKDLGGKIFKVSSVYKIYGEYRFQLEGIPFWTPKLSAVKLKIDSEIVRVLFE